MCQVSHSGINAAGATSETMAWLNRPMAWVFRCESELIKVCRLPAYDPSLFEHSTAITSSRRKSFSPPRLALVACVLRRCLALVLRMRLPGLQSSERHTTQLNPGSLRWLVDFPPCYYFNKSPVYPLLFWSLGCERPWIFNLFNPSPALANAIPQSTIYCSPPAMKFTLSVAALALASTSVAHASECAMPTDTSEMDTITDTMLQCYTDSGFSMSGTTADSIETIQDKLCASSSCKQMVALLEQLWPNECTIEGSAIYADGIDKINTACNWASAHTSSSATTAFSGTGAALVLAATSAAAMAVLL